MYSNWLNQKSMAAHRVDTACVIASLHPLSTRKSALWLGNPAVGGAHYQRVRGGFTQTAG